MYAYKLYEFYPKDVGLKDFMGKPIYVQFAENMNYGVLFLDPMIKDKERNVFVLFRPDGKPIKVVKTKDPDNPPIEAKYCCGRFIIEAKNLSIYLLSQEGKKIASGVVPEKYRGTFYPLKNGFVACRDKYCGVFDDGFNLLYDFELEKIENYDIGLVSVPFVIGNYIAVIYQSYMFLVKDGEIVAKTPINAYNPDYVEVCKDRLLIQYDRNVILYDITDPADPVYLFESLMTVDKGVKQISFLQDCRRFLIASSHYIIVYSDKDDIEIGKIKANDAILGLSAIDNFIVFGTLNRKIELYEVPFFAISCYH